MEPLGVAEDKTWDRLLDGVCVCGGAHRQGNHVNGETIDTLKSGFLPGPIPQETASHSLGHICVVVGTRL